MDAVSQDRRSGDARDLLAAFEAAEAQRIACALLVEHCEAALFELRCSLGDARDPSEVRCGLQAADLLETVLAEWRAALRALDRDKPPEAGARAEGLPPVHGR